MPNNAQEKYQLVRGIIQHLRNLGAPCDEEFRALELEYRKQFQLVSFEFPNPEQQQAEDLGET